MDFDTVAEYGRYVKSVWEARGGLSLYSKKSIKSISYRIIKLNPLRSTTKDPLKVWSLKQPMNKKVSKNFSNIPWP